MLARVRTLAPSYKNVVLGQLRASGALTFHRKRFTTCAPQREQFSKDRPEIHAFYTDDSPRGSQEEHYTSLHSKLDHYRTAPSEPSYKSLHQPLSSLPLPSPSTNHSSQRTFLTHSRRTGLNPASTVFTGTRYEYLTLSSLRRLGIELAKVGGSGDKGVDLVGLWHLPQWSRTSTHISNTKASSEEISGNLGEKIKVVVQCKRIDPTARAARAIGPSVVREMEGAFRGAPAGWRAREGVLGVLVSTRAATKGVIEGMKRSERALAWVLLEEVEGSAANVENLMDNETIDEHHAEFRDDKQDPGEHTAPDVSHRNGAAPAPAPAPVYRMVRGRLKQFLWNQKARELGLEGLDVVKRYGSNGADHAGDEVVLMWRGNAVPGLPTDNT